MKIMGLDLGSRTCGIAISDPSGILATGLETFRFEEDNYQVCLDYLLNIIDNNKVEEIVIGLPKNMDGSLGFQAQKSQNFKEMLEKKVSIPVVLFDERLTSRVALNQMISANSKKDKRKTDIDRIAAQSILQDYLDYKKKR